MSAAAKCYMGTAGVTQGIFSTCVSTNPKRIDSAAAMEATLYKGFFNRLKGVPYEAVQQ
jgi:hypothetical protein